MLRGDEARRSSPVKSKNCSGNNVTDVFNLGKRSFCRKTTVCTLSMQYRHIMTCFGGNRRVLITSMPQKTINISVINIISICSSDVIRGNNITRSRLYLKLP